MTTLTKLLDWQTSYTVVGAGVNWTVMVEVEVVVVWNVHVSLWRELCCESALELTDIGEVVVMVVVVLNVLVVLASTSVAVVSNVNVEVDYAQIDPLAIKALIKVLWYARQRTVTIDVEAEAV